MLRFRPLTPEFLKRCAGILTDFLTPEHLDKSVLQTGLIENFKRGYYLNSKQEIEDFKVSRSQLCSFLNTQYPYMKITLNLLFDEYINKKKRPPLTTIKQNSILTPEMLHMMRLVNPKFHSQIELDLIYSSKLHGQSFNRLAQNLVGWPSPTLVLLKTSYRGFEGDIKTNVMGAMTFSAWEDKLGYFGDGHAFLFTLKPYFQTLRAKTGNHDRNYMYLNTNAIKGK